MVMAEIKKSNKKERGSSLQSYFGRAVLKSTNKVGVFLIFRRVRLKILLGSNKDRIRIKNWCNIPGAVRFKTKSSEDFARAQCHIVCTSRQGFGSRFFLMFLEL